MGCRGSEERSWRRLKRWRTDRLAAREGQHDGHRVATVRADEGWAHGVLRIVAGWRNLWILQRHLQQLACKRQAGCSVAVGQQSVVADAVEASGFRSELWSYTFRDGGPVPVRYGSGADVQLWSTTDLAVQYALHRLGLR